MEKKDETGDGDVVNISHRRRPKEDDGRWEWDGLGVDERVGVCASDVPYMAWQSREGGLWGVPRGVTTRKQQQARGGKVMGVYSYLMNGWV